MYNSKYVQSKENKIIAIDLDLTDWRLPNDLIEKNKFKRNLLNVNFL